MEKQDSPLVVTTMHRGVFFGYGVPVDAPTITLKRARMCIYWPEENHGVMGLVSDGPKKGAKIGPAVPEIILRDVTAVIICTSEAAKEWEKEKW